jgi:hypothetical protein
MGCRSCYKVSVKYSKVTLCYESKTRRILIRRTLSAGSFIFINDNAKVKNSSTGTTFSIQTNRAVKEQRDISKF